MILDDIRTDSAQRITEIRELIDFVDIHTPTPPTSPPRFINAIKGLIFVQLYGTIEFTINSTIARTINQINEKKKNIKELHCNLWSLVLNPELDSLINSNKKKWEQRRNLFDKIEENPHISISNTLMPTTGENFTAAQLNSIWSTFRIPDPVFEDVSFRGRLQDIVTNRINVAHGNSSASSVGSNFTNIDIRQRIQEVSRYCSYLIDVFESYLSSKKYES